MKKWISLFLATVLLGGCAATYDGPTERKYALTEYTVTHYPFGSEDMQYTDRYQYAYDIYGNRVREMEYQDNELQLVQNRKYDDRGNCIEEVYWDHSGWLPIFERRVETTYDDQNRMTSYVSYDFWGRQESGSWYTYDDEAGTRIWSNGKGDTQTAWLDQDGRILREVSDPYETVFRYDDRGNRICWYTYKDGAPYDHYEARYDDQNRQIWGGRYNAAGELESETTWEFNDESHTTTTRRPDGQIRYQYYDADGRLHLIEDYSEDGTLSMVQRYSYQQILVPAKGGETP